MVIPAGQTGAARRTADHAPGGLECTLANHGNGQPRHAVQFTADPVIDELIPSARHTAEQDANNRVEAGHGRRKARLGPMRGLKRHRSARILTAGHAFVPNLRRGHYDIAMDVPARHRPRIASGDLATTL